tara:strand:- start:1330 stop:1761 length:432 start_codon:yes stop_codon:yes gene_type:complete
MIQVELNQFLMSRVFKHLDQRLALTHKYGIPHESHLGDIEKLEKRLETIRKFGYCDTYENKYDFDTLDKHLDKIQLYTTDNELVYTGSDEVTHYIYGHGLVTFKNQEECDTYVFRRGCWYYYINEFPLYFDDRGLPIVQKRHS